jgi:DNA polymerase-3 subunit delta
MKVLLYGSERYFLESKATQLINDDYAFANDLEPIVYDCENYMFSWDQLFEELMTVSFFDSHKVIYCLNPVAVYSDLSESKVKEFASLLETLPEEVLFFMMVESPSIDQRLKLYKPFIKSKQAIKIASLNHATFRKLVVDMLDKHQIRLNPIELDTLLTRLPMHVLTLKQEINKLASYPSRITVEVIDALISKPLADSVFELSKAIMLKNHKAAWSVYEDLLVLKHDPTSLIPAIAWQYRIMYQILYYKSLKLNQFAIQQRLDEHEYTFNKAWQYANRTDKETVISLLNQLANLDQSIKMGKTDKKIGFERFLLEAMR